MSEEVGYIVCMEYVCVLCILNTTLSERERVCNRLSIADYLRMEYSTDLPYGCTMIYAGNPAVFP